MEDNHDIKMDDGCFTLSLFACVSTVYPQPLLPVFLQEPNAVSFPCSG